MVALNQLKVRLNSWLIGKWNLRTIKKTINKLLMHKRVKMQTRSINQELKSSSNIKVWKIKLKCTKVDIEELKIISKVLIDKLCMIWKLVLPISKMIPCNFWIPKSMNLKSLENLLKFNFEWVKKNRKF